ncbi:MAG: peptidylprolyl isomerase [Acidobacteriota bacterium]|nr:MAG: peptidylprolyl isomerase [Acidobacteriota bacterium]
MSSCRSSRVIILTAACLLMSAGCGGERGGDSTRIATDTVGGQPVSQQEFERFLSLEAGIPPEELEPEVRQRFYEEFLAEVLFARAAERSGIEVPAELLEQERARQAEAGESAEEMPAADLRRGLLAQLYEQKILAPDVVVTAEEIEQQLGALSKRTSRQFAVFRQLRADTKETADEAYRRIVRQREPFEIVARELSSAPDAGALQQRAFDNLPQLIADKLRAVREGDVSRPLEYDGAFYLFQLEARNRDPDPGRVQERERTRERLWAEKLARARAERLSELAAAEGVTTLVTSLAAERER